MFKFTLAKEPSPFVIKEFPSKPSNLANLNKGELISVPSEAIKKVISQDIVFDHPIGSVITAPYAVNDFHYLPCDGSTFNKDEYPELYTLLGNTNVLPDLRECALVGSGQNEKYYIKNHDVFTLRQFKDDQINQHYHQGNGNSTTSGGLNAHEGACYYSYASNMTAPYGARISNVTRTKEFGVNVYVRAK